MFDQTLQKWGATTTHRETFIVKSYQHLLLALALFVAIEYYLFSSGLAENINNALRGVPWLMVLGAYMIVAWLASSAAARVESLGAQYAALSGFILVKAIIFVPLISTAEARVPGVLQSAGIVTAVGFVGLTAVAFQTRKDFSFLGAFLRWGGFVAIGLIVASLLFGFDLGMWFSIAMIGFAGCAVLYDTSKILLHYPEDRYVSAGLELFASIMLMLWYVIRFMTSYFDGD